MVTDSVAERAGQDTLQEMRDLLKTSKWEPDGMDRVMLLLFDTATTNGHSIDKMRDCLSEIKAQLTIVSTQVMEATTRMVAVTETTVLPKGDLMTMAMQTLMQIAKSSPLSLVLGFALWIFAKKEGVI